MELFSYHLKNQFQNDRSQYLAFVHELTVTHAQTSLFKEYIVNTGVFDDWLNFSLRMGEFDGINTVNERIAALTYLADIWELRSD